MSGDSQRGEGRNGYLDLVRGDLPDEIVEFEIRSDPSANVLGTGAGRAGRAHLRLVLPDEDEDEPVRKGQHPALTIISLILVAAWIIVPAGLIFLAHTGTWP
jgi:hypothetical protein